MKMYYLSLFFYSLIVVNSGFAFSDDFKPAEGIVALAEKASETVEVDICKQFNLDKDDELKLLIDGYSDEKLIKIIFYSRLLEKNYSLYLCELDKIIDNCFKLNNKRFNLNNCMRLLKAATFFACSAGCAYAGFYAWGQVPEGMTEGQRDFGLCTSAIVGSLCGYHGFAELQKVANNYDQNQLYYKAIAMKNALLGYRKK